MIQNPFIELSVIILLIILVAGITHALRQPLIIAYLLTGIIAGPYLLGITSPGDQLATFAQIGVVFLLFMVGLQLNPKVLKEVGKVATITGLGQIIFTCSIGFVICKLLGFTTITSIYIAIALTFSSTIIIMKLLSDKGDLEKLYGRISVGFLLVQDLVAIIILLVISSSAEGFDPATLLTNILVKGFIVITLLFLIAIYVLPRLTLYVARSQEFLLIFSIGWCLAISSVFHYLNLSLEIGALLAGITLALSPYRHEISARMKPLRDFFIVLFFIELGAQMVFANITAYIIPAIILSLFVLIGNPLIVIFLMGRMRYKKRNSFLSGLTVAQISEFSLILVALGVKQGHLTNEILSFVTIIGISTIAISSYFILYANRIYPYVQGFLSVFDRKGTKVDSGHYHKQEDVYDIVLFGCNRIGRDLLESFTGMKQKFLVVDDNPQVISKLVEDGIPCVYGDANDTELLDELKLDKAKMIISTIANLETDILLIEKVREVNKKAITIVVSHRTDHALELYQKDATYVITPHTIGAHHINHMIKRHGMNVKKFLNEQVRHVEHLKKGNHHYDHYH